MDEVWRPIPGMTMYLVSNRGRVYSFHFEKILKHKDSGIKLNGPDGQRWYRIEWLVKAAFGLGCNRAECCERADVCWRCGLNPAVEKERKEAIRKRGLTKMPGGRYCFVIKQSDYDRGWKNPWTREDKIALGMKGAEMGASDV